MIINLDFNSIALRFGWTWDQLLLDFDTNWIKIESFRSDRAWVLEKEQITKKATVPWNFHAAKI